MGGSRSELRENPNLRRGRILEEFIQILGQRGSNGFRVQELAQRCGLSNAGLLYHFGSKEQLLLAMLDELERREAKIMEPLARAAEREVEQGQPSKRALADLLHTMVARASSNSALGLAFLVLQAEALEESHPAHGSFRDREAAVLDLFARLAAPHVAHPTSAARQLLALMDGLCLQWIRANRGFDIVAEWDRAVGIVLGEQAKTAFGA